MSYWKNSLLIGVPQIDDQHHKLVDAIDELMAACKDRKGRDVIEKTLLFVSSYTKEHLNDEEKLQTKHNYPGLKAHKLLHNQFTTNIAALIKDLEQNGPNVALIGKINKTLVEWLINHINVEDKKLGAYIQSQSKQ